MGGIFYLFLKRRDTDGRMHGAFAGGTKPSEGSIMTRGPQYNFNGSIRTERDVISWGGMVPSEGGFVYRGGTTPEGGIVPIFRGWHHAFKGRRIEHRAA